MGVREGEARAMLGQAVEVRRPRRSAIRRQRIGAQRVDRDQQDVLIGRDIEPERGRPLPEHHRDRDDDRECHCGRHP
jgi:hypothetical protein